MRRHPYLCGRTTMCMARKRQEEKHYVVWTGRVSGIYDSWEECRRQVEGYPAARFRAFPTRKEAEEALKAGPSEASSRPPALQERLKELRTQDHQPVWESISVDAACQGNPGMMEYRGVETATGRELFHMGPYQNATNNIGEFLALVHALAALKRNNSRLAVYTDSKTARKWLKDKKIKTSLQRNASNQAVFDLLDRALKWLEENTVNNPVLIWDTKTWGEIPADFGRK